MKKSSTALLWVFAAVAVIGLSDCANAVQVAWQSVQTISAGTDVDTMGGSVLATYYAPTTGTESVNGVIFTSSGGLSTTQGGVTASLSSNALGPYAGTNTAAANLGQPDSANYTALLNNAVWTPANTPLTLTLTGLTPGQQYRVQFWTADYRGVGNRTSDLTPGSSGYYPDLTLYYGPSTSLGGSTVVGTFTADSATQSFSLVSSVGTQFNAFQLRQVSPTSVTWQPARPITSSTEVGISGSTVLATYYAPSAGTKTVNGVTFTSSGGLSTTQGGVTAALSQNVVNLYTPTNSASGGYGGTDAANYTDLLNNAAWTSAGSPLTLTLTGLTPGEQYRVQFWSADYRGYGSRASDIYTGANGYPDLSVYYGLNAPSGGSRVIGTFTAGSSTQSFTWNSAISPQLNAFQLEVVTSTLVAQPASIVAGAASRLSWSLPTATSMSISPGGPVTGNGVIVTPSNTTTYTLTANTPAGVVTQTATVNVSAPPGRNVLPTILQFGALPLAITSGSATTLKWLVYNATNLAVYPIGDVMGSSNPFYGDLYGSVMVRPTATTTYVLVASNNNGTATATATVTVGTPTVIYGNLQGADLGINASLNGALPFPADTTDPTSAGANSVLNKDISQAPVEPTSSALLAHIAVESGTNASLHVGGDFNYVVVSNSQSLVPINYTLISGEPGPWPVPPDAPVQQEQVWNWGGEQVLQIISWDKHMSVINRDTGMIYEGYYAFPPVEGSTDHSWTYGSADWPGSGQVIDSGTALNAQQIYTKLNAIYGGYGINTGGSYIFPTLLRYDEASTGVIRHAMWMNLGTAARQGTSLNPCGSPTTAMSPPWPTDNATMLPNGVRIRLKSSVVIPSGVCTETQAVLQALKTYGAIPIDTSYQISAPGTNGYAWGIQWAFDTRFPSSQMNAELAAAVNINTDFEVVEMDPELTIGSITTAWPAGNSNPVFGVNGQSQVTFNGTVQSVNGHPLVGMNALGQVNVALNITSGATVNSLTFNDAGFTIEGDPLTLTSSTITAVTGTSSIYSVIAGSVGLTKEGAGMLDACAANTYTGPTVINSGTLQLQRAADAAPTAVTIASGASLQVVWSLGNLVIASLSGSGSVSMESGTLTLGSDNSTTTYAGSINDWGSGIVKVGTGKLTLSGNNTYTGPTTVGGGWLAFQTYNSSYAYSIASGATLEFNVATGIMDLPTATFSGAGTLVKSGTGNLIWQNGAATFAMGGGSLIDVQGGTFTAGSSGNEVWTNNLSSLNIAAGATFNTVEAFVRVDALTGSGTCQGGYSGNEFITVGLNNGSGTFSGVLANFWAPFGLVKTGTGTQTLTGNNTYTGATLINAGALCVNGSINNAAALTVAPGAALSGTGTIASVVTVSNGGSVAPGNGSGLAGQLTFSGTLVMAPGSALNFDLGSVGASDSLRVTGYYATPVSPVAINVGNLAGFGAGTYNLMTGATGISAGSFVLNSVPAGYNCSLSASNGTLSFTVDPIPAISSPLSVSVINGTGFSYQITAGNNPTSFGVSALPPGLSFNTGTGLISGTPTTTGTYNLTVSATNASGTGSATLRIVVLAAAPPAPVITSASSASGNNGIGFSYQITASNGPVSFGATGLPTGLSVNASTGAISGTPAGTGTYSATISASNLGGTGSASLTITVLPTPPSITSALSVSGTIGFGFSYQIAASNSPTGFGAANLPPGLSVDSSTGLINGTPTATGTYSASISATNPGGTASGALMIKILPTPPPAPTGLTATGTNGSVLLGWTASGGATSYNIKRSLTSGSSYITIATGVAVTTYTDNSVSNGTTYYYVVTAAFGGSESSNSNQASAMPSAPGALPSPWAKADVGTVGTAGTSIYEGGSTFVVDGAGGDIGGTADAFQFAYVPTTLTSYSVIARAVTPLTFGTTKVGVMIRRDTSSAGARMAAVIVEPNVSASGTTYQARFAYRASTNGSITWTTALTGLAVPQWVEITRAGTKYTGYVSTDNVTWITLGTVTSSNISSTTAYAGLAVCSRNTGSLAAETFDNVSAPGWTAPPVEPTGLTATTAVSRTQINLNWMAVSGADFYQVYRSASWGGTYTLTGSSTLAGYSDTGLSPGSAWYYMVRAASSSGTSGNSVVAAGATLPDPPAAPAALVATGSNAVVTLSWSASSGATGYNLKRSAVSGGNYVTILDNTAATSYNDTGVTNWTTYYYVVSSINAGGEGANSVEAAAQPQSPPISAAETVGSSKFSLSGSAGTLAFKASVTGHTYQLQYVDSLTSGTWTNAGTSQPGTGADLNFAVPYDNSVTRRFYRLQIQQ